METWISSRVVYEGRIVNLRSGQVRLDDGRETFREVVEHPGGVAVVPCLGDSVVLIRQFRISIGKTIIEIPAGKLERGESPEDRGRTELEEETGYVAGRMVPAGHLYPSCGVFSEKIHVFLAFDLVKTEQRLEHDEQIEVFLMDLDEVREKLARNEFDDAKTIIGLHALLNHKE